MTWRPIVGYEEIYEISNFGVVRSILTGRSMTMQTMNKKGYVMVGLSTGGRKRSFLAHRLVATAFIGPPFIDQMVNHKNAIKDDNTVENLEWVTAAENYRHAQKMGLITPRRGELNGRAKLSLHLVREIRASVGISQRKLACKYSVSRTLIQRIQQGKLWPEDLRVQELI